VDAFTRRFALSPHRYQTQLRVDAARALLAQGHQAVEVAGAVGFADQSHFIRRFKAITGVTPGRYQGLAPG
jgi:AraC-like DNA-binding protein